MNQLNKIKWGIIGCGRIAHKFVSDLALIDDAVLTAVASRSNEKADEFAQKHMAKKAFGSYDELFLDPDVDIVYIATPHHLHAELSIKAMENNKHVLCEKPLSINHKEAKSIIETSKRTKRFFMEALWTRFNPSFVEVKKRIDDGEIGEIKYINADFAFRSEFSTGDRTLDINLGGGALLDIGIYPAFLAYIMLGVPKEIVAKSIFHKTASSDVQTSMIFHYAEAQAILYSSFESQSDMVARISGTKGQIYLNDRWHHADGYTLIKNDQAEKFDVPVMGNGYTYEIIECHNCLRANKIESKDWSHQNSLELISILDDARKQVGLKYPQE
ncbi:MAG: Gfo/Idh/MocA family oxidoreductase [Aureibaculum sp.]|nr:Gfo/Idh/MocA family oxidoreductase [Aureibaculum sp.]